jgi:hypothetical protein
MWKVMKSFWNKVQDVTVTNRETIHTAINKFRHTGMLLDIKQLNQNFQMLIKRHLMKSEGGEKKKKRKAIPVTDHEGPHGCETLRLPHFV